MRTRAREMYCKIDETADYNWESVEKQIELAMCAHISNAQQFGILAVNDKLWKCRQQWSGRMIRMEENRLQKM